MYLVKRMKKKALLHMTCISNRQDHLKKVFNFNFFETDEIQANIKICYSYIAMFTIMRPR